MGNGRPDWISSLERLAGLLALAAAAIYVAGGGVWALRLGRGGLTSMAVVAQLPREFLISQGLLVVTPGILLGTLAWWLTRWIVSHQAWLTRWIVRRGRPRPFKPVRRHLPLRVGVAIGIVTSLLLSVAMILKAPYTAKLCATDGSQVSGVLIGETASRTYIGDPAGAHPRRIISVPLSLVARLFVGGRAPDLEKVVCPSAVSRQR